MRRIRGRFLMLYILYLLVIPVRAWGITLSLDEAVQRALNQSLNLKKSSIDLAEAGYSAKKLWSEIFPGISLSVGMTFLPSTELFSGSGFRYRDEALSYSLNAGVSLALNTSSLSAMKRIELAYKSQLLSYENASRQLEIQVIKNFLRLITMRENIAYMRETLQLAEQKLGQDRVARENGLLNELAWLNSMFSVETARYNLFEAQGGYQNALGEFFALLGMDAVTDIDLEGTVGIAQMLFDPEELIMEYLPKRPDIISQRQTIERLELSKKQNTLSSRSPTLNFSTQWRGGSPSPNAKGLGAPFADSVSGSVTLNIPVDSWIPGTRQNQALRAADAEVEKAKLDLQNTEVQAKTQIRSFLSNLNNTWESLKIARLRVEIAKRTVETADEGFKKGTVEFNALEEMRKDLNDARQRLLQGEFSYQSLILDLAAALNIEWKTLTRSLP
ncbi:MAG: TolC family protein [Treponema sp.]|nr:TolC family protein [Treponema sp.]